MKKLILLIIPIFILPGYTNKSGSQVMENEIKDENLVLFSLVGDPEKPLIVFVTGVLTMFRWFEKKGL